MKFSVLLFFLDYDDKNWITKLKNSATFIFNIPTGNRHWNICFAYVSDFFSKIIRVWNLDVINNRWLHVFEDIRLRGRLANPYCPRLLRRIEGLLNTHRAHPPVIYTVTMRSRTFLQFLEKSGLVSVINNLKKPRPL